MWEIVLAVLFSLFHIDGLFLRAAPFGKVVEDGQKRLLKGIYFAAMAVNSLVMYLLLRVMDVSLALVKVDYFLFPFLTVLANGAVIRGRMREHLFVYGIWATCNFMLSAVPTYFIGKYVGMGREGIFLLAISQMLLQWAFFVPIRRLLRNTVEPFLTLESGSYWATIWIIPIAMLLAAMVQFPGNVHVDSLNQLASRAFTGVATILMCYSIAADHRRLQEQQEMTERLMDQKIHYYQLQTKVEDARKKGHDFKHHIAAIRRFIDTDNKEGLRKYCDALYTQTQEEMQAPYTGNPAADGVVYRYVQLSRQQDVRFEYQGSIHSEGIEDVDLCVLLGNALDNALAGCSTVQENRRILVAARTEGQVLSLMVKNTFDGVVNRKGDTILSRKRDNRPGVGLASMGSVCERYGGQMMTQWDDTTFTTVFLLPLKK